MLRTSTFLLALPVLILPLDLAAQEPQARYQVGFTSAVIANTMSLSGIDSAFDDLDFDGIGGPHTSGVFFLVRIRQNLRIGLETLAANSSEEETTTMNYQAAGPVIDLSTGTRPIIGAGLHVGTIVANAMADDAGSTDMRAVTGTFFKGAGGFVAPYASLGLGFGRSELRLFIKPVFTFGTDDELSDFSAWFAGLRYAIGL